ncbi:MAG: poly-gamma-glutamate biosynthesis protein PgsC [Ruminococcaceae bacterium]|nr:poly-gamma-glutamate biosynthesis protein PgsC [Oscillospiraceae bacterium]
MNELAVLALLISLIFTELTNLLPGGIIVPFYFALYLDDPVKILATVISALIAMVVVKFLSRYTILYGRRKFALYLIIGILEKILFTYLYFGNSYMFYNLSMTIGYLVPGILGREMEKQGVLKTLGALTAVTLIIRLVQIALL